MGFGFAGEVGSLGIHSIGYGRWSPTWTEYGSSLSFGQLHDSRHIPSIIWKVAAATLKKHYHPSSTGKQRQIEANSIKLWSMVETFQVSDLPYCE